MDFNRFVKLPLSSDIKKALYHCEKRNDPFILWQNVLKEAHRIKKNSSLIKYDIDKEEIALKPRRGMFQFFSNEPLYFYIPKRKIIFKRFIFYNSPLKIVVKDPKEVLLNCSRIVTREVPKDKTYLSVQYGFEKDQNLLNRNLKLELIDYSEQGISLKSSLNNILKFEKGRPIKIEKIKNPGEYLEADIKYITRTIFPTTGELYFKIGCEIKS